MDMGINGKGLMSTLILTGFWNRFLTGSGFGTGFLGFLGCRTLIWVSIERY